MSIIKVPSKKAKKGYTYKVTFKYKENDITKTYSKSGFIVKKDAQEHESMVKAQINQDGYLKKVCNDSLNKVFNDWLKVDSGLYALNTINLYKRIYNKYIYSTIGKEKIISLKYKDIQAFINESNVSYDNCVAIKKVLNNVFKYAIKNEYIETNPIAYIEITKTKEKKEINNYLSLEEYNMIIEKLNHGSFYARALSIAISIGYHTGLRISEIFALNKSDIDFINDTITVNKQLLEREGKNKDLKIKTKLKTSSSNSVLPLVPTLKEILIEWFDINPYEKVVCNEEGYYLNPVSAQARVKKIASDLGIQGFHFHMLRHTLITNLYKSGVDVKTTQELARHSNINTTLNVYTHLEENSKKDTLNNVFEQIYSKNTPKMDKRDMLA